MSDRLDLTTYDGVIFDFDRAWTDRHPAEDVPPGMAQKYNTLHELAGLESSDAFWGWFAGSGGFRKLPLYPAALPALRRLGHHFDIHLATARPPWAQLDTLEAIAQFGEPIPRLKAVWFEPEKEKLPVDLWIEDNPLTINRIVAEHGPGSVIRVDRPWNHPADYPVMLGVQSIRELRNFTRQLIAK